MPTVAKWIFEYFWLCLAVGAAVGEWALLVWLAGLALPLWAHPLGLAGLAAFNRAAAIWCERERHLAPVTSRIGSLALAAGLASFIMLGLVGVAAAGWIVWSQVVPPAAAGAPMAAASPWASFDPLARIAAACGGLLTAWGYLVGHRRLRVGERTVPIVGLPPALEGLRIAHLSDLHLGPLADRRALRRALARVTALEPDVICITGDIVDSPHCDLPSWVPELRALRARHGVYAILGNHDRATGADTVAAMLGRCTDITLLRDGVATIERDGARLAILGLEDRHPPRVTRHLARLHATVPAGVPVVLLSHRPDAFPEADRAGIPLTLAGHTHAGQLAVPFLRHLNVAHVLVSRYDVGWFRTETNRLHVSSGLGVSGQRVRIGTRPEITVIRLVPAVRPALAA